MSAQTPPLRVLIVGQAPTTPGGIASVQRLHAASLRRRADVEVSVVITYDEIGPVGRLRLMVTGLARALALVARRRVDVVDLHVAKGLSVLRKGIVVTAARARGVPTVLHAHAGAFSTWFDGLPRPVRVLVAAMLRPDRVIVLSEQARGDYAARLRMPTDHVLVAANPVEIPEAVPDRPTGGPVEAVFLGRLIDRKGVFDLLDALAELGPDVRRRLHVTVAGHGDADAVRRRVEALDLDPTVEVRPWLGPDDRDALLRRAQLLVLPSWWEALPMAVLEAMAWGVTPIVTPVGTLSTLIRDGQNGVVVPLQDPSALAVALEKLLDDDGQRRELGIQAREDVRGYGADAWADHLVALYRSVLRR